MSERRAQNPKAFAELFEPHRFKVYYGGRGGAKSTAFANALLAQAYAQPLRVMCTREIQNSIKDSVHALLKDRIAAIGLNDFYDVQEAQIVGANGSRFFFAGLARNPDSLKSAEGVDRCWVEEGSSVSRGSWDKLIPTIRKPGSEIWVSYNPGLKSDAVHQIFHVEGRTGAMLRKVSWRDNPWFSEESKQEMEDLKRSDHDKYLHIWEGEFMQFADGAIYGKQLKACKEGGRIIRLPIETGEPVHTFWDLGRNDSTAIWMMQHIGPQHRFIDYYESRLEDLEHYVRVLKDRGYLYGTHHLPHDVEHDILGMPETRRKMLEKMGIKPLVVVPRIPHINEGIELTRKRFGSCWFDEVRCERGLECLSNYQFLFDEKYDTFRQTPAHTWASHGADAFRMFGEGYTASGWKTELGSKDAGVYRRKTGARLKSQTEWMV